MVGEYTKVSFGDPALILSEQADGTFQVIESFEGIHTPVTVSERMTNGWHDIIYQEYGRGAEDGYRICHYNPNGGYQTDLSEVVDEVEPQDGTRSSPITLSTIWIRELYDTRTGGRWRKRSARQLDKAQTN